MCGFSDSFNVSVSAAIILYQLRKRMEELDLAWQLSEEQQNDLRYRWIKNSIRRGEEVAREYKLRLGHPNEQ
jgi:tRNA (guanosine-2'-O-)-methyltransferase